MEAAVCALRRAAYPLTLYARPVPYRLAYLGYDLLRQNRLIRAPGRIKGGAGAAREVSRRQTPHGSAQDSRADAQGGDRRRSARATRAH
jgi:hypothetical protein